MELATLPLDEKIADQVWRRLRLDQTSRVIVLNTGSAVGSAKHWPSEYYVELAQRIVADSNNAVLIICGPAERSCAEYGGPRPKHRCCQSVRPSKPADGDN
jgi:ADP-heptose:LPS heptosyltransferase